MTEPTSSFPPPEPHPVVPRPSTPPTPSAYPPPGSTSPAYPPPGSTSPAYPPPAVPPGATSPAYPPPAVPPTSAGPAPKQPSSYGRLFIGFGIIGGMMLIGIVIVVAVFVQQVVSRISDDSGLTDALAQPPFEPLLEGPASDGVAVEPTDCDDACFAALTAPLVVIPFKEAQEAGMPALRYTWNSLDATTVGIEYEYAVRNWTTTTASPDDCFFVFTTAPLVADPARRPASSSDPVHYLGDFADKNDFNTVSHTLRVFENSQAATDHMAKLRERIEGCTGYESGSGLTSYAPEVTPAPALDLPDTVAALGWREDDGLSRYYAFDLQRGNFVVRIVVYSSGAATEQGARDIAEAEALRLADLHPTDAD